MTAGGPRTHRGGLASAACRGDDRRTPMHERQGPEQEKPSETRVELPPAEAAAAALRGRLDPAGVLRLQRAVGNAAVGRILARAHARAARSGQGVGPDDGRDGGHRRGDRQADDRDADGQGPDPLRQPAAGSHHHGAHGAQGQRGVLDGAAQAHVPACVLVGPAEAGVRRAQALTTTRTRTTRSRSPPRARGRTRPTGTPGTRARRRRTSSATCSATRTSTTASDGGRDPAALGLTAEETRRTTWEGLTGEKKSKDTEGYDVPALMGAPTRAPGSISATPRTSSPPSTPS